MLAAIVARRSIWQAGAAESLRMEPDAGNGILSLLPGERIGFALTQCPDANTATADTHQVTIEAGWVGRVVITCTRKRYPRSARYFWTAVRADQAA